MWVAVEELEISNTSTENRNLLPVHVLGGDSKFDHSNPVKHQQLSQRLVRVREVMSKLEA